jgi:hypothetical protein
LLHRCAGIAKAPFGRTSHPIRDDYMVAMMFIKLREMFEGRVVLSKPKVRNTQTHGA